MNKKHSLWLKVSLVAVALVGVIVGTMSFNSEPTYATVDNVILKKALGYGISECYKQGAMNSPITAASYNSGYGANSLVGAGGGTYTQPTGAYGGDYSLALSCSQLLNGNGVNGSFAGALNGKAPSNADDTAAFSSFMTSMGYDKSSASSGQCAPFTYTSGSSTDTLKLCAETDNGQSNGKITGKISVSGDGGVNITFKITDTTVEPVCSQLGSWASSCTSHSYTQGSTQFDVLMGEILGDLIAHRKDGILGGSWKLNENLTFEPMGDTLATYKINSKTTAAAKAASYLTGYSGSNLALTPTEQLALLQDYMLNFYAVERYGGACNIDSSQETVAKNAGYSMIETSMFGSGLQKCWVRPTKNKNSSVAGFDSNGYFTGTPLYYADVVKAFGGSVDNIFEGDKEKCNTAAANARNTASSIIDQYYNGNTTKEQHDKAEKTIEDLDKIKNEHGQYWYEDTNGAIICYQFTNVDGTVSNTPTESTEIPDTPTTNPDGNNQAASDPCFNAGATLGWIICPVLDIAGKAATGIYEKVVEPFLEVKAEWLGQGTNSVYGGWTQFRDFANIMFVIAFIVVILAQVTGIGISNYGIKKILPRLIMIVVLVNASYILCQLATDISNILGASLQDLFVDMANKVGAPSGVDASVTVYGGGGTATWFSFSGIASTILTIIIGGGAAWGLAVTWEIWLIPLLLTILGCGVGILFFFVILGVRQAGVLILTALAPVAIVCYALPNTKSFFDKWKRMYIGLLVVYPICGALIGGGQFASALLINAGGGSNFFYDLVAMLVQVVPFFFIPAILKGSMAAMGNLGLKIAGIGDRVGRFARSTVGNARPVKEKQQEWLRNNNQRRDQRLAMRLKDPAKKANDELSPYLERMRRANIDASDEKAVKTFFGDEYGKYRQAKNRAAKLSYRANQARKRYEGSVMEDLQASTNAQRNLLTFGSERYNSERDRLVRRQVNEEARGLTDLYTNGTAASIRNGVDKLDVSNEKEVVSEFDALLDRLDTNPEDNDALAKMQALSNAMMGKGEFGETAIRKALEQHIVKQHTKLRNGDAGAITMGNNNGLRQLSSYITSGPLGGRLKTDDRDTFDMANALAQGSEYYKDHTGSPNDDGFDNDFDIVADGAGFKIKHKKFDHGSARKLSARGLADSNDAVLDRIHDAVVSGSIKGEELNTLMQSVDEALNNETIQLKAGVRGKLEAIAKQAYSKSGGTSTARTADATSATIMANAGTKTLDAMLNQAQGFDPTATPPPGLNPAQLTEWTTERNKQISSLRTMAENAKYALENNIVKDTATAERLQDIVRTVQSHGISDFAGNTGANSFKLNSGAFKVRGAVQPEGYAQRPDDWEHVLNPSTMRREWKVRTGTDASGHATYRNMTADEQKHFQEIEAYNRQVDMRNSAKGFKPSSGGGSGGSGGGSGGGAGGP